MKKNTGLIWVLGYQRRPHHHLVKSHLFSSWYSCKWVECPLYNYMYILQER